MNREKYLFVMEVTHSWRSKTQKLVYIYMRRFRRGRGVAKFAWAPIDVVHDLDDAVLTHDIDLARSKVAKWNHGIGDRAVFFHTKEDVGMILAEYKLSNI